MPQGSAVYLTGSDKFWGFSDIDVNSTAYDWGYSLMPDYLLSDEQTVAYAPGNIENDNPVDYMACSAGEGRDQGLFVTPVYDNTTFFIDKNGDGIPDSSVTGGSVPVAPPTTPASRCCEARPSSRRTPPAGTPPTVWRASTSRAATSGKRPPTTAT